VLLHAATANLVAAAGGETQNVNLPFLPVRRLVSIADSVTTASPAIWRWMIATTS